LNPDFPDTPYKSDQSSEEKYVMVTPESMKVKAMDLFANDMY